MLWVSFLISDLDAAILLAQLSLPLDFSNPPHLEVFSLHEIAN